MLRVAAHALLLQCRPRSWQPWMRVTWNGDRQNDNQTMAFTRMASARRACFSARVRSSASTQPGTGRPAPFGGWRGQPLPTGQEHVGGACSAQVHAGELALLSVTGPSDRAAGRASWRRHDIQSARGHHPFWTMLHFGAVARLGRWSPTIPASLSSRRRSRLTGGAMLASSLRVRRTVIGRLRVIGRIRSRCCRARPVLGYRSWFRSATAA